MRPRVLSLARTLRAPTGGAWTGWGAALCLAAGVAGVYLAFAAQTTLWDRDEPRFAQAAVEMVRSGRYLYPTFNGDLRPQKPILTYLLMASTVRWFGAEEIAVRFWSPLALAVACLLTYAVGRRLWNAATGLLAMGILAATPLAMLEAVAATADALLLAAVTGALAAFLGLAMDGPTPLRVGGLVGALALGQLIKGPVGLAVPGGIALATLCLAGPIMPDARRRARIVAGALAASFGIYLLWAVPAALATDGRIITEGIGREVFLRAVRVFEGHGGHFLAYLPFYPLVVVAGFFPWILFLPGALSRILPTSRQSLEGALLTCWIAIPLGLFTMAATKLPHYILPIWPALALSAAWFLMRSSPHGPPAAPSTSPEAGRTRDWSRLGGVLFWGASGVGAAGLILLWQVEGFESLCFPVAVLLAALLGTCGVVWATRHHPPRRRAGPLLTCCLVMQTVTAFWMAPELDKLKAVPRLAAAVADAAATPPVAMYEFLEPSVVFYFGRPFVRMLWSDVDVLVWALEPTPGVLVLPRSTFARLCAHPGLDRLTEIAASTGFDFAKGQWIELVAVKRQGDR